MAAVSQLWRGREAIINDLPGGMGPILVPGTMKIELVSTIAEGDRVVAEWASKAQTVYGGIYDNRCVGIYTVRDGLVISVIEYADTRHVTCHGKCRCFCRTLVVAVRPLVDGVAGVMKVSILHLDLSVMGCSLRRWSQVCKGSRAPARLIGGAEVRWKPAAWATAALAVLPAEMRRITWAAARRS